MLDNLTPREKVYLIIVLICLLGFILNAYMYNLTLKSYKKAIIDCNNIINYGCNKGIVAEYNGTDVIVKNDKFIYRG